jgi:hypothetical protein
LFETNKINNGLMQHGSKNVQSLLEEEVWWLKVCSCVQETVELILIMHHVKLNCRRFDGWICLFIDLGEFYLKWLIIRISSGWIMIWMWCELWWKWMFVDLLALQFDSILWLTVIEKYLKNERDLWFLWWL